MLQREFDSQILRLRDTYGERTYPETRCIMLWNALKNCADGAFSAACTHLILNSRQPPMLEDFKAALPKVSREAHKNAARLNDQRAERLSPWPLTIEGLMGLIRDNEPTWKIEKLARHNKLSDEDAWYLWECFQNKRFDDPKASMLVNRVRESASQSLGRAMRRAE